MSVDVGGFYNFHKSLCKRKKIKVIARSSREREIVEKNSGVPVMVTVLRKERVFMAHLLLLKATFLH